MRAMTALHGHRKWLLRFENSNVHIKSRSRSKSILISPELIFYSYNLDYAFFVPNISIRSFLNMDSAGLWSKESITTLAGFTIGILIESKIKIKIELHCKRFKKQNQFPPNEGYWTYQLYPLAVLSQEHLQ